MPCPVILIDVVGECGTAVTVSQRRHGTLGHADSGSFNFAQWPFPVEGPTQNTPWHLAVRSAGLCVAVTVSEPLLVLMTVLRRTGRVSCPGTDFSPLILIAWRRPPLCPVRSVGPERERGVPPPWQWTSPQSAWTCSARRVLHFPGSFLQPPTANQHRSGIRLLSLGEPTTALLSRSHAPACPWFPPGSRVWWFVRCFLTFQHLGSPQVLLRLPGPVLSSRLSAEPWFLCPETWALVRWGQGGTAVGTLAEAVEMPRALWHWALTLLSPGHVCWLVLANQGPPWGRRGAASSLQLQTARRCGFPGAWGATKNRETGGQQEDRCPLPWGRTTVTLASGKAFSCDIARLPFPLEKALGSKCLRKMINSVGIYFPVTCALMKYF